MAYRIGFEYKGVTAPWVERIKETDPTAVFVTMDSPPWGFGVVACACPTQAAAEALVARLNLLDQLEAGLKELPK